ncbi:12205_t:CDS:2 [Racocetra fulgida]|uniref:12205_t:CDS:1 n=1 Tax=Racocetra fulgida TaxID=60492 RepID=A0A9N9GSK4_9GLOM|nr:12205_t:CDS:2 [Racocetra fulgida]
MQVRAEVGLPNYASNGMGICELRKDKSEDNREGKQKIPFPKFYVLVNLPDDDEIVEKQTRRCVSRKDIQIPANAIIIDLTKIDKEPENRTEKIEVIDLTVVDEDAEKPSRITEDKKIIETAKSMIPEIINDVLRVIFKHVIDDIFENILKDETVGKEARSIMCTDRRFNILFANVFFKELNYYVKKMRVFETLSEDEITSEINDVENTELLELLPKIKLYRSEFLLRVMTKNKSFENIFLRNKDQAATEYIYMILEDIMIRDNFDSHIFAIIKKVFSLEALEKNGLQDMLRKNTKKK